MKLEAMFELLGVPFSGRLGKKSLQGLLEVTTGEEVFTCAATAIDPEEEDYPKGKVSVEKQQAIQERIREASQNHYRWNTMCRRKSWKF